jgi:hypothetical protein
MGSSGFIVHRGTPVAPPSGQSASYGSTAPPRVGDVMTVAAALRQLLDVIPLAQ